MHGIKARKVHIPSGGVHRSVKNRTISRRRSPTRVTASAAFDPEPQIPWPTIVLRRRYPHLVFPIPPLKVPVYWFDEYMVDKKLILPIPPDTFAVDNRRFKVLAQDRNTVGRWTYTRWLVYEEAAVPKGQRP